MSKIFYICDRKKCSKCNEECHHTSDIEHALHFKPRIKMSDGKVVERGDYFEEQQSCVWVPTPAYPDHTTVPAKTIEVTC